MCHLFFKESLQLSSKLINNGSLPKASILMQSKCFKVNDAKLMLQDSTPYRNRIIAMVPRYLTFSTIASREIEQFKSQRILFFQWTSFKVTKTHIYFLLSTLKKSM